MHACLNWIHLMYTHRFNSIFATRSFPHLRHVFDEYNKLSKKNIEKAIESEMSGDFKRAMLTIGKERAH